MKSTLISCALVALGFAIAPPAYTACKACGTVVDMKTIKKQGEGSGVGAVAGGVLGGVLGHQVGGGRGKDVATVAGAAGGAYVGHQVEKEQKSTLTYQVQVKMEEGNIRTFNFRNPTSYKIGDEIKIVDGKLTRR